MKKGRIIKNFITLIIIIFIIGCNSDKRKFQGYYYNQDKSEIYFFSNSKVDIFNFSDSTAINHRYDVDQKIIKIGDDIFNFKKVNDTLYLNNYSLDSTNIKLVKFDYKQVNLNKIDNKYYKIDFKSWDWDDKRFYDSQNFIKIDISNGVYYYSYDDKMKDTLFVGYYQHLKENFEEFILFKAPSSAFIVCNQNLKEIEVLSFNGMRSSINILEEFKPENIPNEYLFDSWIQIKKDSNKKFFQNMAFQDSKDRESYEENLKKIKEIFNLNRIEFKKNQNLKRFYQNDSIIKNYQFDFGINDKYLFVKDFYEYSDFEIFIIEKLTKDSLSLRLNNWQIRYDFIKDK